MVETHPEKRGTRYDYESGTSGGVWIALIGALVIGMLFAIVLFTGGSSPTTPLVTVPQAGQSDQMTPAPTDQAPPAETSPETAPTPPPPRDTSAPAEG